MSIIGDHLRDDSCRGMYSGETMTTPSIEPRFIKLRPQIADDDFGSEPPLYDMVVRYYVSYGIDLQKARELTVDYFYEWNALEKRHT